MSVFDDIAEKVASYSAMRRPLDRLAIKDKLTLSTAEKGFIERSRWDPIGVYGVRKEEISSNIGGAADYEIAEFNYYNLGLATKGWSNTNFRDGVNIRWAKEKLKEIGSEDFTRLFGDKLWNAVKETSIRQNTQSLFSPEDLFYFYAGAIQRLIDPRWEKYNILAMTNTAGPFSLVDQWRFETLRKMVPDVFEGLVETHDDDNNSGTFSGIFNLGPHSIPAPLDEGYDIFSSGRFDDAAAKIFWYRAFGSSVSVTLSSSGLHKGYSANTVSSSPGYGTTPTEDNLLIGELWPSKDIYGLFDLEMILNLRDDIEANEDLYRDYYSTWENVAQSFSVKTFMGPGAGLTFEQTLKFWQVFIEKYLEGDIDQALLEQLEREGKEQADLFIFNPDMCEILTEEAVKDPCPPPCVPNPDAITIDWTRAPNEQPFLNEKTCEYWVPITTEYENVNERPATAIVNEQIEPGMKLILDFVGKESTEDIILSLFSQITTDYFVDFRTKSKVKVLIKLPFDAAFALESKEPKTEDETTDSSEFPLNVVLTAKDIRGNGSMLNLVSRAIGNKYSQQYEILRYRGEMSGIPQDIMLKKEGDRIRQFKTALIDLLKDQNFKFNPTRKKTGVLEAVEIGFKEEFKGIEYVKANNIGCEASELGINKEGVVEGGAGWKSFLKKSVVNYPTTLAFMANIPSIYENVTADSPMVVDLFLKSYFFPRIEETIGQELTMTEEFVDEGGCNTAEMVANLLKPAAILGSEVAGTALSFPELFFKSTPQKTCLTLEGKKQRDAKYKVLKDVEERWKDAELRELFTGDAVFEDLPHKLDEVNNLKELYSEILNKLGVCGLSALAKGAMSCLLKGLDIEVSMSVLVKSFIKGATDKEMENVFFALHPGLQQFVRDSVAEITSIPLPWEAGYRPGSYQAAGVKYSADYSAASGSIETRLEKSEEKDPEKLKLKTDEEENLKRFRARTKTTIQEQEDKFKSSDPVPSGELDADGNEIMVAPPDRVSAAPGLGPRSFAGPFAHAGSVGTALDAVQDNAIEHLKTALLKAIAEEIISPAAIMSLVDKIPGAELLKGSISETLECPFPPLFSPPLDDILKTLELDFCKGHYAITLPVIRKFKIRPFLGDIKTILIEAAEDALEKLVAKAMITILKKILTVSLNASCEVLRDAAATANAIAGGSEFREIVAENICGDSLNDEELNASLNKLNESLGSLGLPGAPKPTDQDMGDFMDGVSAILNQQELLELLEGEPTPQAVAYVRQIVNGIPNLAIALPTDDHIRNLFAGMGRVFDRRKIRDRIKSTSYKPISPSVCASPEHLIMFNDIRCSILAEKGVTPEQCEEQLENLKDRALLDFEDLADVLNQNYFGDLDILGDPTCPGSGIYPSEDPETKKQTQEMFSSTDAAINSVFMTELLTRRGMLNMILADTNGAGFKRHNEFWVSLFGQSLSEDLGILGFYADYQTTDPTAPATPLYGLLQEDGHAVGIYPDKVAPYLQEILAGTLNVDFELSEDPNLSLKFDNWDTDFVAPRFVKVDYNYQKDNDTIINIKIYSEDDKFGPPLEFDAVQSYDPDTLENIINLEGSSPNAPYRPLDTTNQAYIFGNLLVSSWSPYTTNQSSDRNSFFSKGLYEYLTTKIIEKFAFKISENVRTFNFGYDPNAEAKVVELNHEEYGGTEKNPAFYVEPPKYSGWLGLYDKIIPEIEDCDRKPILNFDSISKQTSEYNDKLKDDPRLQIPAACAIDSERPFDRIMPRESLAGTDGAIRSTVRLYVMETFLKGLPSFSLFDPKFPQVYNDTLSGYIAEKMKTGLLNTGLNFKKKKSRKIYYYKFLEEVVQNFGKKVDIGDIVPNAAQISAMESINNLQEKWRKPPRKPRITYPKRLRDKWTSQVAHVEPSCLILLNHYISEQIEEVGKLFSDSLKPSIPNLESWIFGSPDWMVAGAISGGGPMDVATNPLDPLDPTTVAILALEPGYTISIGSSEPYAEGYFPFILEKYIKVIPQGNFLGFGSGPQIFGLQWWKDYLAAAGSTTEGQPIIDNYGEMSYGLRISMVMPQSMEGHINAADFDASISWEQVNQIKSLKFGDDTNRRYVVPVATAEVPINGNLNLTSGLVDQYDINCMISELINTPEYKTLFNYCLPLQSLLSLVTIYTIETFLLSIGSEWDKPGGAKGSQFKRWDKEANFKKTKKNLRRLFEGYYHSRDANYEDEEEDTNEEKTRKKIKVKRNIPTDKDIAWWKRRLEVPKPTEECE